MKKALLFFMLFFGEMAHAGPMANVEYIHKVIEQQWGITVPYNPELKNPKVAANMKYLLTAVDVANKILHGKVITDYGNGEYATLYATDTIATNKAISSLVVDPKDKFVIITTPDTSSFYLSMTAVGDFTINWGDGTQEQITRTDTTQSIYSHAYSRPGRYRIALNGQATEYNVGITAQELNSVIGGDIEDIVMKFTPTIAAISFVGNANIAQIKGSLGAIFPTIDDGVTAGQQPLFPGAFAGTYNLNGTIPTELFDGVYGVPRTAMFGATFAYSGITGGIPDKLFAGIAIPAGESVGSVLMDDVAGVFLYTFAGCEGLRSIPDRLFAGQVGGSLGFMGTFLNCTGLKTIPEHLFDGMGFLDVSQGDFMGTFAGCTGLTAIPVGLFEDVQVGPLSFASTFAGCTGLTSIPSGLFDAAKSDSGPLALNETFSGTFEGCTGLKSIPERLFAGVRLGAQRFDGTFAGCTGLKSIPENLFAGISLDWGEYIGYGYYDFYRTFQGCTGLTSIPETLFTQVNNWGGNGIHTFDSTFADCTGLTAIPEHLFDGLGKDADQLNGIGTFNRTFANCINLTGPSIRIDGKYLYEFEHPDETWLADQCYLNDTGLSDYDDIPDDWK